MSHEPRDYTHQTHDLESALSCGGNFIALRFKAIEFEQALYVALLLRCRQAGIGFDLLNSSARLATKLSAKLIFFALQFVLLKLPVDIGNAFNSAAYYVG